MIKAMNNARVDRLLYVLDNFHEQPYFTREDVIKDFMDEKQHVLFDKDVPVAVFTLETVINKVHLKRFSILGFNFNKGYMKKTLELMLDEFDYRLFLTVLPSNKKMVQILEELGFYVDGQVKSSRGDDIYVIYSNLGKKELA